MVEESWPKTSWSAPVSTYPCTAFSHSSGVPTMTRLAWMRCSISSSVGSGISSGQSGTNGGFGNVSR